VSETAFGDAYRRAAVTRHILELIAHSAASGPVNEQAAPGAASSMLDVFICIPWRRNVSKIARYKWQQRKEVVMC